MKQKVSRILQPESQEPASTVISLDREQHWSAIKICKAPPEWRNPFPRFLRLRFELFCPRARVWVARRLWVCASVSRDGPLIEQLSLLAERVYQPDGEHRGQWHWHIATRWACCSIHCTWRRTRAVAHTRSWRWQPQWCVNRWSRGSKQPRAKR